MFTKIKVLGLTYVQRSRWWNRTTDVTCFRLFQSWQNYICTVAILSTSSLLG